MSSLAHELRACLLCRSTNLEEVLKLRGIPIATAEKAVSEELRSSAETYAAVPLNLNLCLDCGQLQTSHCLDVEFNYQSYTYETSQSIGLFNHFREYAQDLLERFDPPRDGFVVEIGSNDGTLAKNFAAAGMNVLGVDPSPAAEKAISEGIATMRTFFSPEVATRIRSERGPAQVVIANFVTANIEDMIGFADGVRILLDQNGLAVIETQYGVDVIEQNLLDTVYHEHLSYFNVIPLMRHYARHGLELIDVTRVQSKGGSIRLALQPLGAGRPVNQRVRDLVAEEERKGVLTPRFYAALPGWIEEIRRELERIIGDERAAGRPVAGWGVSIGTTTLLGQFDLGEQIDFLVDDNPDKPPFLVGPGYKIPVVKTEEFYARNPGAVIVFAWRYIAPIMERHHRYLEGGGKFVVPLPHVSVVAGVNAKAPNTVGI